MKVLTRGFGVLVSALVMSASSAASPVRAAGLPDLVPSPARAAQSIVVAGVRRAQPALFSATLYLEMTMAPGESQGHR